MDATGITAASLKSLFSGIKKGDCVGFGRYCQENSSEKTPIEWLALQTSGTTVLLISRCALDCKPYQAYYKEDMTRSPGMAERGISQECLYRGRAENDCAVKACQ